jgi:ATP-dependent RNA helicase DDX49/DBP8
MAKTKSTAHAQQQQQQQQQQLINHNIEEASYLHAHSDPDPDSHSDPDPDTEAEAEAEASGSSSDSLDSQASRKKRKVEPTLPTKFSAPSRIRAKVTESEINKLTVANPAILVSTDLQTSFADLNIKPWLVGSLGAMAIRRPTGVQKLCIPEILKGRDCIGGSRTGSGKTVAFAVPILQKWAEDPFGIFAVVLTPTRYGNYTVGGLFPNVALQDIDASHYPSHQYRVILFPII